MTPIERLQAAIEKLERLRDAAPPAPWEVYPYWGMAVLHADLNPEKSTGYEVLRAHTSSAADLASTLSRTIDAQLSILRFAVDGLYDLPEFLMLADAILGSDS